MRTVEIPRDIWVEELNEFTTAHEGRLVSLDVFGPEIGAQPEFADLPLIGVSADRIDHDGTIVISVAQSANEYFTHIIRDVARMYLERTDDGAPAALLLESVDGTRTVLQLRADASQSRPTPGVDPPAHARGARP